MCSCCTSICVYPANDVSMEKYKKALKKIEENNHNAEKNAF